jgi:predicted DNA-binding mobile mystery protein A
MSIIRKQQLRTLDARLAQLRSLAVHGQGRPAGGWIKALREALGMTTEQLAKRLQIARQNAAKLEASERDGRITLETLRRVANALDAELVYAIVPRNSIQDVLEARAHEVARQHLATLSRSMQLEQQEIPANEQRQQVEDYAQMLLERPRELWR